MSGVLFAVVVDLLTCLSECVQAEFRAGADGTNYLEIAESKYSRVLTDYVPVTPGKTYELYLRRYGDPVGNIDVRPYLYDEDRFLLGLEGYPADWKIHPHTFHSILPTSARRTQTYTIPVGVRYMRFGVSSEKVARVAVLTLEEKGGTPLVEKNLPLSAYQIVVPMRSSKELAFAAVELSHWIKVVSGKRAEVVSSASVGNAPGRTRIYLGRDFLSRETGKNDSWIIAGDNRGVFLTATQDAGVVNAVFDLLERNTDLVFARAENQPGGIVFTPNPDLAFKDVSSHVVPAFGKREFGCVGLGHHAETWLWHRRNYLNCGGCESVKRTIQLKDFTCTPFQLFYEVGSQIPNDKYFKAHPEWFGMREGKRIPYEHYGTQICYSCLESQREIAKNICAELRRDLVPGVTRIGFGFGDTWAVCRCPDCVKDVKLPSGRVLTERDVGFRSRQWHQFLFSVVREIRKEFPDLSVENIGYLYSAVPPPELEFPPKIEISYCPYPKICRVPVYDDKYNAKWHAYSEGWGKAGCAVGIFEYYGDAIGWPRPGCDTAQKDMIYWNGIGIDSRMYCEMPPDLRRSSAGPLGFAYDWDLSAMENWVLARLFVDPKRDVAKLRADFCRRAYHEAAGEMLDFFSRIHKAWYANPNYQGWSENPVSSMNSDIRTKGLEKPLTALLERAAAKVRHPGAKELVAAALLQWKNLVKRAEKALPPREEIPFAADGASGRALMVTNFACRVHPTAVTNLTERTACRVSHDNNWLTLTFGCEGAPKAASVAAKGASDAFPAGESVGVLIRPGKDQSVYYHFLVSADGKTYDAKGYDELWNAEGFTGSAKRTGKGWRAELKIPFGAIGVKPTVPEPVYLNFVRNVPEEGWRCPRAYTSSRFKAHDTGHFREYGFEMKGM